MVYRLPPVPLRKPILQHQDIEPELFASIGQVPHRMNGHVVVWVHVVQNLDPNLDSGDCNVFECNCALMGFSPFATKHKLKHVGAALENFS